MESITLSDDKGAYLEGGKKEGKKANRSAANKN